MIPLPSDIDVRSAVRRGRDDEFDNDNCRRRERRLTLVLSA